MKFAHYLYVLERDAPPQWSGKFIKYKYLKKLLKECVRDQDTEQAGGESPRPDQPITVNPEAEEAFFTELRTQLSSTNDYFQKQADKTIEDFHRTQPVKIFCCYIRLSRAGPHEYSQLAEHAYWCRKFARCNAVALRKILKKHDKVCGNAKGRAFLQECWRMEGAGRTVGLFLHSPLLDELKAVQDVLQERLAEFAQQDVAVLDDDPSNVGGNAYKPEDADFGQSGTGPAGEGVTGGLNRNGDADGNTRLVAETLERHNEHHNQNQKGRNTNVSGGGSGGGGGGDLAGGAQSPRGDASAAAAAAAAVDIPITTRPGPTAINTTNTTTLTGRSPSIDGASAFSPIGSTAMQAALDRWESGSSLDGGATGPPPSHGAGNSAAPGIDPDSTSSVSISGLTGPTGSWKGPRQGGLAAIIESPSCLLNTSDFEWAGHSEAEPSVGRGEALATTTTIIIGEDEAVGGEDGVHKDTGNGNQQQQRQRQQRRENDAEAPGPVSPGKEPSGGEGAPGTSPKDLLVSPRHGSFKTEDLRCPICLEVMYKPVGLGCGHKFCRPCALEAAGYGHAVGAFFNIITHIPRSTPCPQCRQPRVYETAIYLKELGALIKSRFPEEWAERRKEDKGRKQLHIGYVSPMLGGGAPGEGGQGRRGSLQSRSRRRLMSMALGPVTSVMDD